MKLSLYLILFLAFIKLNAQEINFETDWETAVDKATKEKKLIFMDVYTTWCRPCKSYDKDVFTDSSVANFFNAHFINLKCNAEKDWGIKIAKRYKAFIFPTFIFIEPNSLEVFYQVTMLTQTPKTFREEGIMANRTRNEPPLSILMKEYDKGRRDVEFLKKIIHRKSKTIMDFTKELLEFIRLYPFKELDRGDRLDYSNLNIKYGSSEYFQIKNTRKPDVPVSEILIPSINAILDTATRRKNEGLMEQMLSELNVFGITNQRIDYSRIDFYRNIDNFTKAFTFTEGYISKYLLNESLASIRTSDSIFYQNYISPFTTGQRDSVKEKETFEYAKEAFVNNKARLISGQINDLLLPIIFKITDKEALKKILKWSALCVELEPSFYSLNYLYAIALYKNGEKANAIKRMEITIEQYRSIVSKSEYEKSSNNFDKMNEQLSKMKSNTL